jgi:hypothetical protein
MGHDIATARGPRKKPEDETLSLPLGHRLYRMFLLSILFAVLWVKGYLWSAFLLALLLLIWDAVVVPVLATEAARSRDPDPPSRPERTRWKWTPEDAP